MKNHSKLIPAPLQKGGKILLIATARKISEEAVDYAKKLLGEWGYEVEEGAHLRKGHFRFAGTDAERQSDLQWALDHQEAKAIICFRGGYGTLRALEGVCFEAFRKHPKWVCGFSDVTAFHQALSSFSASIHSTMPINFEMNTEEALSALHSCLKNESYEVDYTTEDFKNGEASAPMVGGNLSMLYSLGGTPYEVDTDGKILIIEDLDEYLYHIDRMMQNFRVGGKLKNLKGLIIGGFTDLKDNDDPFGQSLKEIILNVTRDLDIPIAFDFPCGHFADNRAIPLGVECRLEVRDGQVNFKTWA